MEIRRGLGDLLQFVSLNLQLDLNFEENPYPIREIWNSHHNSWYGKINNSGWNENQVTCSNFFWSTCILTWILKRICIWIKKCKIITMILDQCLFNACKTPLVTCRGKIHFYPYCLRLTYTLYLATQTTASKLWP